MVVFALVVESGSFVGVLSLLTVFEVRSVGIGGAVSRPKLFRLLFRRGDLGRLVVRLLLVAFMKLEFATFKIGVGRARRILCEYGTALVGSGSLCAPRFVICDGGIQGAKRWIRPRICCGIRNAVASAYIAPAECARIENLVILRWLQTIAMSSDQNVSM